MKTALILGISGGFGRYVARALLADGWELTALVRASTKVPSDLSQVRVLLGDPTLASDVRRACQGQQVLVYGLNPGYADWPTQALAWLQTALAAAKAEGARLVFPGNLYNFNPLRTPVVDEHTAFAPVTAKGEIRCQQEAAIAEHCQQGGRALVLRCGDFLAADAPSSWWPHLFKTQALHCPGNPDIEHSWAYLPDLGQCVARLLTQPLPDHCRLNFRGHQLSLRQWQQHWQALSRDPIALKGFPWWLLQLISPFHRDFRELLAMRYLWQQPLSMSNAALESLIGPEPHTPARQVLSRELGLSANETE